MQRIAPNAMPPRKSGTNQPCGGKGEEESPAYRMARRIQREQGPQRATQYLNAMEPFLAPAERAHIAERLGLHPPMGRGTGEVARETGRKGLNPTPRAWAARRAWDPYLGLGATVASTGWEAWGA